MHPSYRAGSHRHACKAANLLERPSTPAIGIDGARASTPRKRTRSHPRRKRLRRRLMSAVACNRSDFSTEGGVENAAAFGQIVQRRTQFLQVLAGEAARRSGMLALFIGDVVQRWQGQRALSLRQPPLGFLVLLAGLPRRLRRTGLPDVLHEMHPLLPQETLNAADGIALAIKEMADSAQEIEVLRPVIAAPTAALHRPDLMEAAFPEPQAVVRKLEFLRHFADRSECARCLLHRRCAPLSHGCRYFCALESVLMRCLRIADGLNTITRRGEIGTSLPVLGLRPILWPFLRTTNEPNDESLTVSPRSRQSVISFNTSSTSVADSVRDKPTFW